jgi:DNA topoisomerase-1
MQLIIAEKPKVAEKIAYALAEDKKPIKHKGYGQASYYEIERNGQKILVAAAVGHLYSLDEKNKSSSYPVFEIEWCPAYKVNKKSNYTKDYIKTIEELAKKVQEVIIACDFDIEGSLIGYNVLRFSSKRSNGKRMKFSSLTKEELIDAFENRMNFDIENALAGEARHILDWFYGINLSRALMSAIKSSGRFQIMSIGRVQGPTLNILGTREIEIKNFKPTPYWEISAFVDKIKFLHEKEKFFDKKEAEEVLRRSSIPPWKIEQIIVKEFKQKPNPPFDLTDLQLEAYRVFKFSPFQTQNLAQNLYENSMISYPRTSSQKLPQKLGLSKIIEKLSAQKEYEHLAKKLLDEKRFKPHEGKKTDPAHPAIYPTGIVIKDIGEKEKKLYDLIVKRFLACFAPDATKSSNKVILNCNQEKYFVQGVKIIQKGWIEFYQPYYKEEEIELQKWTAGQEVKVEKFTIEEKLTKPPKRYSIASIISELEKRMLGTKATRAVVLETLFKRGYLKGKKAIEVTPFGLAVLDILKKYSPEILDEELTREIEKKMDLIQQKAIEQQQVIEEGKNILTKILEKFKRKEIEVGTELNNGLKDAQNQNSILGTCPKCKGQLKILTFQKGKQFVGCSNYPNCDQTYPLPQYAKIQATSKICPHCHSPIVTVIRKGKKTFSMCLDPNCPTKKDWNKENKK